MPAGAAGHREHVPGVVVGRQLGPRHGSGEDDRPGHPEPAGQPPQAAGVGPAADQQQRRVRDRGPDVRPGADQRVLSLAGHEAGHADHHRPAAEPEPFPEGRTPHAGAEGAGVDPGREPGHPRRSRRGQRARQPHPGVLTEVGDRVHGVAYPAEQAARGGQHRPARLMAVGDGHQPPRPRPPQRRCEQAQRRRRAEQHRVAAAPVEQPGGPPRHRRHRQHQGRGMAFDREGKRGVELGRSLPCGRVDADTARREPDREGMHEGLDPACPWREIVGHDQDLRHRAPRSCAARRQRGRF